MINKIASNPKLGTAQIEKLTAKKFNELIAYQKPITLTDEAIVKWNLRKGYNANVLLTDNRTLSLEQLTPGDYGTIKIIQDASGIGYNLILPTIPVSKVSSNGGGVLTLTATANAVDIATFYYDGVTLYWTLSTNFT